MTKVGTLLGTFAAVAALGGGVAAAAPGELDYIFGRGGKVTTPARFHEQWSKAEVELAEAPDGRIVIAGQGRILRYLADGELDPSFGSSGVVSIGRPRGLQFAIGDLAVDPEGRVVLIGTAAGRGPASFATVIRYGVDGKLDPSFGESGVATMDFSMRTSPGFGAAAITATLGSVDDRDRITLIAGTRQPIRECGGPAHMGRRDRLIARLDDTGVLDRGFSGNGVAPIGPLHRVVGMAFDSDGGAVLAGAPRQDCDQGSELALIRFDRNGARKLSFGKRGSVGFSGSAAAIAMDDRDRILVLWRSRREGNESLSTLVRLLPNGEYDKSFWDGWTIVGVTGPLLRWSTVAVDMHGRPLLIGTLVRPMPEPRGKGEPRFHRWFLVMPISRSGRNVKNFGFRGWLEITRFYSDSDAAASEALIDREGQLLIAGTASSPRLSPATAFALTRFRIGVLSSQTQGGSEQ